MRPFRSIVRSSLGAAPLLLVLCGLLACQAATPSYAAGLAEEHTVLYYLVETQRRFKKSCDGQAMPQAPSLVPSESLRRFATEAATKDAAGLAPAWGLEGVPHFIARASGNTPQQAFDALLRGGQCTALMGAQYKYIGASRAGGQWTVVLSGAEPRSVPPLVPGVAPVAPDVSTGPGQGNEAAAPQVLGEIRLDHQGNITGVRPPGETTEPARPTGPRPGVVPLQDTRSPDALGGSDDNTAFGIFANDGAGEGTGEAPSGDAPGLVPLGLPHADATSEPVTSGAHQARPGASVSVSSGQGAQPSARDMLALVNTARTTARRCGQSSMPAVPRLAENSKLVQAAQSHVKQMHARGFFSSTTPEGETLGKRVTAVGYNWGFVAENIASRVSDPAAVLESWLEKEDQCSNIMGREFSQFGAAYDPAGRLWVLILATPLE